MSTFIALAPPPQLPFDSALVARLGWTLLHFLWQGAAAAALLSLALAVLRGSSPQARYGAGCAALLVMALCPAATFLLLGASPAPDGAAVVDAAPVDIGNTAAPPLTLEPPLAPSHPVPRSTDRTSRQFLHPLLVSTWIAGVVALSAWRLIGWLVLRHHVRTHSSPVPPRVKAMLDVLRAVLGVGRAVAVFESAWFHVPAVVGVFRPVVLIPASALTGLTAAQLEAILAHELAHVRRHDYLVNLLQAAAETMLFYHPAVWWVSARVREERENCCDDVAASATGDRVAYARALATLEGLRVPGGALALAAAGTGATGALMRRVRRLLGAAPSHDPRRFTAARCFVALTLALAYAGAPMAAARFGDRTQRVPAGPKARGADASAAAAPDVPPDAPGILAEDLVPRYADYRIGPDDQIQVLFRDLTAPGSMNLESFRVSATGNINLPYVGEVKAAGLTEAELAKSINDVFRRARLLENANTGVHVTQPLGRRFNVMGDASRAGSFELRESDFRLLDALMMGGAADDAEEVVVIRKPTSSAPDKPARTIRIPARKLLAGDAKYNVVIRPGDTVRVRGAREQLARLVADAGGGLTLDGKATTWEALAGLLDKLPADRKLRTRLLLVPASEDMTLKQLRTLRTRAEELAKKAGLKGVTVAETEVEQKQ